VPQNTVGCSAYRFLEFKKKPKGGMLFIELEMLKESMKEGPWVTFSPALMPQMTHISSILSILNGQPCEMPDTK
jgi:hypothetical protein